MLTPPDELWKWLHKEAMRRHGEGEQTWRIMATLRWLVLAELDRTAPTPLPKPSSTLFGDGSLVRNPAEPQAP